MVLENITTFTYIYYATAQNLLSTTDIFFGAMGSMNLGPPKNNCMISNANIFHLLARMLREYPGVAGEYFEYQRISLA